MGWLTRLWNGLGALVLRAFFAVLRMVSGAREHRLEHDGLTHRYLRVRRPGRPRVVLIHGFADRPESFLLLASLLRGYDLLLPALPGFWTDVPAERALDVGQFSRWVQHVMQAEGFEQAHVLGNSLGGAITLHLAAHAPGLVKSLIPLDAAGVDAPGVPSVNDEVRAGHNLFRLERPEQFRPFLRRVFRRPPPAFGPVSTHLFAEIRDRGPVFDRIMADLKAEGLRHESQGAIVPLEQLEQRALVVWGAHDDLFPVGVGEHLARRMGAELAVIGHAGHCPHMETPFALAGLCRGFWQAQEA